LKRLLRNKSDHTFFKDGAWTQDVDGATEFLTAHHARKARTDFNLKEVELYYLAGDKVSKTYDWTIPLH
jgi:hypothetical protein